MAGIGLKAHLGPQVAQLNNIAQPGLMGFNRRTLIRVQLAALGFICAPPEQPGQLCRATDIGLTVQQPEALHPAAAVNDDGWGWVILPQLADCPRPLGSNVLPWAWVNVHMDRADRSDGTLVGLALHVAVGPVHREVDVLLAEALADPFAHLGDGRVGRVERLGGGAPVRHDGGQDPRTISAPIHQEAHSLIQQPFALARLAEVSYPRRDDVRVTCSGLLLAPGALPSARGFLFLLHPCLPASSHESRSARR